MVSSYYLYFKAKHDLENIIDNILSSSSSDFFNTFLNLFDEKINKLLRFPEHCPNFYGQLHKGYALRRCILLNYIFVYFFNEELNRIDIVRVFHYKKNEMTNE